MRVQLIDGWKTVHKWWSSKLYFVAMLLLIAGEAAQHLLFTWGVLPHEFKESIPEDWVTIATLFVLVASFLSKYVREKKHHAAANKERAKREGGVGSRRESEPAATRQSGVDMHKTDAQSQPFGHDE